MTPDPEGSSAAADPPSEALSAYAQFLKLREQDPEADFESFCDQHPRLAPALDALHRTWNEVGVALDHLAGDSSESVPGESVHRPAAESGSDSLPETLDRLSKPRRTIDRYRVLDVLAQGGMGRVLRVWDEDLRRQVAMKVVLEPSLRGDGSEVAGTERTRRLARFLEEAQITGQLDHPGIVPVHELGLDEEGRAFFTLKLVRGQELRTIFSLVRSGEEGWNQTRALGTLLRVCEAMAFAHEHGVVHRDLKPSNIMVGRHGETYVMDWGLARLKKAADDESWAGDSDSTDWDGIVSERHESGSDTPGSPLVTADGEVLGTPQYMSPEQARGELDRVGPAADVYAVGAMLYELLAGKPPYPRKGPRGAPYAVVQSVIRHAPPRLSKSAHKRPPELVAICEKAMSRRIRDRYPDMSEMAEDLRAFLEGRVVRAWRTGALVELRKWVGRNRLVAALLGLTFVLTLSAGLLWAWQQRQRQRESLDRLASAFVDAGEQSWPIHPDSLSEMDHWLAGAKEIVEGLPGARRRLETLNRDGTVVATERSTHPHAIWLLREEHGNLVDLAQAFTSELARLSGEYGRDTGGFESEAMRQRTREIWELELRESSTRRDWLERRLRWLEPRRFEDESNAAEQQRLTQLVTNLEYLADQEFGLIPQIETRARQARRLRQRTLVDVEQDWERAIDSISNPTECPAYSGLRIQPQLGLIPLRRDPETELWEFWHVLSGERPEPTVDGQWEVRAETGLVFILIPGGESFVGAQAVDQDGRNYDPNPHLFAVDVVRLDLWPFFLSKYELTQAQWGRLANEWPSLYAAGHRYMGFPTFSRVHPVETVPWEACHEFLSHWQLVLPTEAQWETAARAGFGGAYGLFETFEELPPGVNCADETFQSLGTPRRIIKGYDDGWPAHSPVTDTAVNPWGLFGMFGNVSEWTRDSTDTTRDGYGGVSSGLPRAEGTGETQATFRTMRTYRGGNYTTTEGMLRPASWNSRERGTRQAMIGVRPSRPLKGYPPLGAPKVDGTQLIEQKE